MEHAGVGPPAGHDGRINGVVGVIPAPQQVEWLGLNGLGSPPAALGEAAVQGDAVQPGADRRLAGEAVERPVGVERRLLHHVFGAVRADDLASQGQQPRAMPLEQSFEADTVARSGRHDQVEVGRLVGHRAI